MSSDDLPPLVEVTVLIGGDLPESRLRPFLKATANQYKHQFTGSNLKIFIDNTLEMLNLKILALDNAPFDFTVEVPNGELEGSYIFDCAMEELSISVRNVPFVNHNGQNCNEAVLLMNRTLGVSNPMVVPTDGESKPTTLVEDVFYALDEILTAYEKPYEEIALDINDQGTLGEVAKRRLSGEALRKILTEALRSRIAYPSMEIPPFRVMKGK